MATKKIVLLAGDVFSTNVVFNALNESIGIDTVIVEEPIGRKTFIKKRIKKLGFIKVAGQILFQVGVVPVLAAFSKKRKATLQVQYQLNSTAPPSSILKKVSSVNSDETLQLLQQLNPDLVVVNGTRIISKKILSGVPCQFINAHAGITPKYRGVHGTYWALANDDAANSGVTVHLVDTGIDTGAILYQASVTVSKEDNFTTYPLLQLAARIPLLIKASKDVLENNLQPIAGTKESRLWHHPTIWQYFYYRLVKKVK